MGEVLSLLEAKRRRAAATVMGQRFVFTNGCFDIIHPGHVELLKKAKSLGRFLCVGVNADRSVRALKGPARPIQTAGARAAVVAALAAVDYVVLFDEDTPLHLIQELKPDVLVKGGDYRPEEVVGRNVVEAYGGEVHIVPLLPGHSSSQITERIRLGK